MIRWLALLLAVLAAISLFIGDATFALPDGLILWQLRVPRTLLGMLVGGGLGLSGAVLQGALRNPLADPGLLGITGTAGLGAVIAFYWGLCAALSPRRCRPAACSGPGSAPPSCWASPAARPPGRR